jgi:hypothetical protein
MNIALAVEGKAVDAEMQDESEVDWAKLAADFEVDCAKLAADFEEEEKALDVEEGTSSDADLFMHHRADRRGTAIHLQLATEAEERGSAPLPTRGYQGTRC